MKKCFAYIFAPFIILAMVAYLSAMPYVSGGGGGTSFSVTDITGQTDDSTPATTATAVLAQGGSLIESTLGQIATAISGSFAPASGIALTALASQNAYTINGNATAGSASPTAIASSANVITMLGSANNAAIVSNIGAAPAAGSTSLITYGPTTLQEASCTANALTLTPTAGLGIVNISVTQTGDANCAITMGEVGAVEGTIAVIKNVSDGAAETLTFTSSANVLALIQGSPYAMAIKETLILQYKNSEWLEIGRSSGTISAAAINLPSSDADPAAVAGQVRHDSTNTGSNANGSFVGHDGAQIREFVTTGTNYTIITKTEFLPIAWAVDGATAPSAIAAVTGKEINARSFTEADDVVFWWIVPNDYVGGIKYRVLYALSANASADDTAVFSMAGSIVANSGDLDGSAGTALTISDELTTDDDQYQLMVSDYSAESNADWSLTAGGVARLNFSHAAASDMVGAGEPLVIGIEIKYKAKVIGFAGY